MAFFPSIQKIENGWGWPKPELCASMLEPIVSGLYQMKANVVLSVQDLTERDLWVRIGPDVSAIGNLLMHLRGSEHQWIGNKIGRLPLIRDRDKEFSTRGGKTLATLLKELEETSRQTREILSTLTEDHVLTYRNDQGFSVEFILHYTNHYIALHLGQIIAVREYLTPGYRLY
jgi:uncharacterized damage-inducible protein DinB